MTIDLHVFGQPAIAWYERYSHFFLPLTTRSFPFDLRLVCLLLLNQVSSLQSHAKGSEGEEARLSVPGQSFLVRPRRLGGACSMHELGDRKGGREALRASVLWQLHDPLLSKSMWKHHQLGSYIHGLDRILLRGLEEDDGADDDVDGVGDVVRHEW